MCVYQNEKKIALKPHQICNYVLLSKYDMDFFHDDFQAKSFRCRVIIKDFVSMFPAFISENTRDVTNGLKSFY